MKSHALSWAQQRRPVFPLNASKRPRITGWPQRATTDPETIEGWWTEWPKAGIGGTTDGWLVVDVDPRNGGSLPEGLPPTRIHASGRGDGGQHLIYALPADLDQATLKAAGSLGAGVDLKATGRAYIVLPPTLHPATGQPYEVTDDREPAPAPAWLVDKLRRTEPARQPGTVTPIRRDASGGTTRATTALSRELATLATAAEGGRNNQLNACAFNLGQLVGAGELAEQAVRDALADVATDIGLEPGEIRQSIDSGLGAGMAQPRPSSGSRPLASSQLVPQTISELLMSDPAEPLVGELLYRDTLAQIAGPPGAGKSFLAVGLACAVASGKRWGRLWVPRRGRVLYVAAEGGKGIARRIAGWCHAHDIEVSELEQHLTILPEPLQLGDTDAGGHVAQGIALAEANQYDMVVLDTRARSTVGLEENSATDQGRAIEAAERIRRASESCVLVVHHTGKSGEQRGTTAWPGAVWTDATLERSGLVMDANGDPLGCTVTVRKHKDAELPGPMSFDLVPVTLPAEWTPHLAEAQTTLAAVPTERPHPSRDPRLNGKRDDAERDAALDRWAEWLRGQHEATGRVPSRDCAEAKAWRATEDVKASATALQQVVTAIRGELEGGLR